MFWLECISPHRQRRFKICKIDWEDYVKESRPIAKGDLKWRDALLVAHCVNSNGKDLVSDGQKTVDIYQTSFYTNRVKKTRGACVPG